MICSVCGSGDANRYWSDTENGEGGKWYHLLCLAHERMGHEETALQMTKQEARGYLAAMVDGEGHVKKKDGCTEITNNDLSVLAATRYAARLLGLKTKLRSKSAREGYPPTYGLSILGGAEARAKLSDLPIVCRYKRENLAKPRGSKGA